ncbi:MAG TPA: conjugal transfer protein TrbL family protein [Chloroflexota bacterium]|jgi:hypothetical protein|nr:conjugal transfer protein TrbL family protein [Chloroflexota bacterium]
MKAIVQLALLILATLYWLTQAAPTYAQAAGQAPSQAGLSQSDSPSGASGAAASMPNASSASASGSSLPFGIDLGDLVSKVFNMALFVLFDGIAEALKQMVGGLMSSQINVITQTPPAASYGSGAVLSLWGIVRAIANAALALVAAWAGFDLMLREHIGSPYHEVAEILPRLVLGAVLVNTSLSWGQLVIDVENALCGAIGAASLPGWQDLTVESGQVLIQALAALAYLVTSLLLLLQMYVRLALIDLLLVTSPIALLCWVLPQTQRWSSLWSSAFFGAVFGQFAQVVALKLGDALMNDVSMPSADGHLLTMFLGIALMTLTIKIPAIIGRSTGDGLGFTRYLVYRQAARALTGGGGGGGNG